MSSTILSIGDDEEVHFIYPPDTDEEIVLKQNIAEIQRRFQAEIDPYVDRLTDIQARKTPQIYIAKKKGTKE